MNEQKTIAPANEVIAGLLGNKCAKDIAFADKIKSDPKQTLSNLMNCEMVNANVSVRIMQNTEDKVNIPLPHYSKMGEVARSAPLSDSDLAAVAGGEVFITVAAIGVGVLGASVVFSVAASIPAWGVL